MDKKTYTIGVLSIIAAVLFVGTLMPVQPTQAATTIKDRDYTLATTRGMKGGENLYVIDNRTGQIMALSVDNRGITPLAANTLTTLSSQR